MLGVQIALKRVYEEVTDDDGVRVLVDRLWPRGISKGDRRIDEWYKEVAPSHELRRWFHKHGDFETFAKRYRRELVEGNEASAALKNLCHLARSVEKLTLVFASKDETHNNAVVLQRVLQDILE